MSIPLYNSWKNTIQRSLYNWNKQDVEESFNDALLLIIKKDMKFTNEAHAYSYLKTTTKYFAMNYNTKQQVVDRKNVKLLEFMKNSAAVETTLDLLIRKEDNQLKLKKAISYSDNKQKLLIKELTLECDRSIVGSNLNISESTVNSQIRHIKNKVKGIKW